MPNPFFYGGKITNPADFIGRESELRKIFSGLDKFSIGQAQHFSIVGPRRIGKSSLLYYLTLEYKQPGRLSQSEKYRFINIDLDDPHCHKMTNLLGYILKSLGVSGPSRPSLAEFYDAIVALHRKGICPVLCVDEFEHLTKDKGEFPDLFFETLRSLGNNSHTAFITASKQPLADLLTAADLTSSFHNIFIHLPLNEFKAEEGRALLARNQERPFTEVEQRKLFKLAGYHPAKLQIAAQLLYEAKAGSTFDWKTVQENFENQWKQVESPVLPDSNKKKDSNWLTAIGNAVLGIWKKPEEISHSTATLAGAVLIIAAVIIWAIVFLLLTGRVAWADLLNLYHSLRQPPPTPTP